MQKMYKNKETQISIIQESSDTNFSWNEYSHYHDYFVELLSYSRKHNFTHSNIWEFCYV